MLRMKIQTIRSLLWTGNLLAIAGIALLIGKMYMGSRGSSKMFQYMPRDRIEKAMQVDATLKSRETGGSRNWSLLDSCWNLNVTGKEAEKPVDVAEGEETTETLKPLTEILRVEMIMVAGPELSRAAISYIDDDGSGALGAAKGKRAHVPGKRETPRIATELVRVGAELRPPYNTAPYHGRVQEITSEGVKFSWGGDDVIMAAGRLDRGVGISPRKLPGLNDPEEGQEQQSKSSEEARMSRAIDKHGWFIGTEERDRIVTEQEQLLDEIGVGAAFNKRENRMHVRITKIPSGSLAEQRGFKQGDVLRKINGNEIVSKSTLIKFIQKHPDLLRYSIEIERRGVRIVKTFQIAR